MDFDSIDKMGDSAVSNHYVEIEMNGVGSSQQQYQVQVPPTVV
jgi:hypothetical protein